MPREPKPSSFPAIRGALTFYQVASIITGVMLLLLLAELQSAPPVALHVLGLMLLAGRTLHASALSQHPQPLASRVGGMILTFTMIGLAALGLLLHRLF